MIAYLMASMIVVLYRDEREGFKDERHIKNNSKGRNSSSGHSLQLYSLPTTVASSDDSEGKIELDALFVVIGRKGSDAPNGQAVDTRHGSGNSILVVRLETYYHQAREVASIPEMEMTQGTKGMTTDL